MTERRSLALLADLGAFVEEGEDPIIFPIFERKDMMNIGVY